MGHSDISTTMDVYAEATDEKKKEVLVLADKDNLSLAIGKKGQNVRLASRLTHYKLNVQKKEEVYTLGSNEE